MLVGRQATREQSTIFNCINTYLSLIFGVDVWKVMSLNVIEKHPYQYHIKHAYSWHMMLRQCNYKIVA
jgi:hypothetical protein